MNHHLEKRKDIFAKLLMGSGVGAFFLCGWLVYWIAPSAPGGIPPESFSLPVAAAGLGILIFGARLHSCNTDGNLLKYVWRKLLSKRYHALLFYGITLLATGSAIVLFRPGYAAMPLFFAIPLAMGLVVISGIACLLRRQWIAGTAILAILISSFFLFLSLMIGMNT